MHFYTIGHSTRSLKELIGLLKENKVKILADVRRWPRSKHNPQFNKDKLVKKLPKEGIKYEWLGEELGGYQRKGLGKDSPNKAWKSKGFRNYADHTMSEEFEKGIKRILELAEKGKVAYMCAERMFFRCHRRIISDYLLAKGHQITHIIGKGNTREHELTQFAEVRGGKLTYPKK